MHSERSHTRPHCMADDLASNGTECESNATVVGVHSCGGASRNGIAFDGANVWIANLDSNNAVRIRTLDGARLDTFVSGASGEPVYDGTNIWVTNRNSGTGD
jgi:hypothetical protein